MIRAIADGEQITEPGAYRVSMDHYHTQEICPGPSVSSTGLRKIALESPHAFWKTWNGNPDRYPPRPQSDSLILGKAAHCLILGDEVFDEQFAFVPGDAPKKPTSVQVANFERDGKWSDAAAEGGPWWAEFDKKAQGRMLLTSEQVQKIQYMSENLAANPLCVELLRSDLVEISMIWQDPATGIWVKARPDCIPTNGTDVGDLKTFAPKSKNLILSAQRSITDYGYALQMALALMGAEAVFGTSATTAGLVFTQTSEPYEALPIMVDEDTLYWSRVLIRGALDKMGECLKSGDWPGVGIDPITYSFPPSMAERFADMQHAGELPNIGA